MVLVDTLNDTTYDEQVKEFLNGKVPRPAVVALIDGTVVGACTYKDFSKDDVVRVELSMYMAPKARKLTLSLNNSLVLRAVAQFKAKYTSGEIFVRLGNAKISDQVMQYLGFKYKHLLEGNPHDIRYYSMAI